MSFVTRNDNSFASRQSTSFVEDQSTSFAERISSRTTTVINVVYGWGTQPWGTSTWGKGLSTTATTTLTAWVNDEETPFVERN